MSACPSENTLVEFIEGRLSPEATRRVREHLAGCAECQTLVDDAADAPEPQAPRAPPRQIEEYRLIRPLGRGAMGQVHLGHDTLLDRKVAIKFMDTLQADESSRERFLVEARAIARLSHPNVVTIHRVGQIDGWPFLVSEFVSGRSLDKLAKPVASAEALRIAIGLSRGLSAAHRHGVLHRDIKPANAMLADDGSIKLLDFGLAKLLESAPAVAAGLSGELVMSNLMNASAMGELALSDTASPPSHPSLTQTGTLLGTPFYIAPEIWRGQPATSRSDVYSLGALLYELCSARHPHEAATLRELEQNVGSRAVQPLCELVPTVDKRLAAIIDRCLATDPQARFESGEPLCQALEALERSAPAAIVPSRPRPRPMPRYAFALVPAIAAVGLAGLLLRQHRPSMVTIPGGAFQMGSTAPEIEAAELWYKQHSPDFPRELVLREQPRRAVSVSTFRLDTLEVTNQEFGNWLNQQKDLRLRDDRWAELDGVLLADLYPPYTPWHGLVVQDGRITAPVGTEHKPATQLTWEAARRYCVSRGKRLPTEAEWEFAARGRKDNRFPWGPTEPTCESAVFGRAPGQSCASAGSGPRDVGTTSVDRTPEGVFDLGGNVSEWVEDAFLDRYPPCASSDGTCRDPHAPEPPPTVDTLRVFRGGNFLLSAPACRVASRSRWEANQGLRNVGFRCALSGA